MINTNDLQEAIDILKQGGLVIYPTDTAYGVGCRIDDVSAVNRLFEVKKRPTTQAVPVLVNSIDMALAYFHRPSYIVRHIMKKYWPGGVTIVAYCKKGSVYSPICGKTNKIGLRIPDHEVPLTLIKAAGVPILGPSANFHGQKTPYLREDLDPAFIACVDKVIIGSCPVGQVSTVVDCSVNPYKIIRQGAVEIKIK